MSEKGSFMGSLEYWTWCDELTISQAALLCLGLSPDSDGNEYCENWDVDKRPRGYEAVKRAITGVITSEYDEPNQGLICGSLKFDVNGYLDYTESTIHVGSLKQWLIYKNKHPRFFFPEQSNTPDYLDTSHPRYSPKLAAAVKVWEALEDNNLREGKSTKAAAKAWLETRYKELGLIHDGKINATAIEEVAKIVNHDTGGGAPTTPN
jgi:hypothetical protein